MTDVVLVVDDNSDDVLLIGNALAKLDPALKLLDVQSGAEAMDYLKGEGKYGDREVFPIPRLLLLDLKMPILNGIHLLDWMRRHELLGTVPVVVMSGLAQETEKAAALQKGAVGFFAKPAEPAEMRAELQALLARWGPQKP